MRILFLHQNFPAQFRQLSAALARQPGLEVFGMGDKANIGERYKAFDFPVFGYAAQGAPKSGTHHYLASFERAVRRGQDVVRALQQLKAKSLVPDLIVGHPAWGELLFVKDVFPDAKTIAYFEFFYRAEGADVGFDPEFPGLPDDIFKLRIRNSTQLHALSACDAGVSPTTWQRSTYPERERERIRVIHEGVNLEALRADAQARFELADGRTLGRDDQVITYISRQLEPYRGFHVFMRALPELQRRLPRANFVIVGGDGVSYGGAPPQPYKCFRDMMLAEVGARLDLQRTHFVGQIAYARYLRLLQVSRLHVYLTYPFVLSWSMLEAMACGVPVLASATPPVQEIIRDRDNGFLFDFFDAGQLADRAVEILGADCAEICSAARRTIETEFSFRECGLPAYLALIEEASARGRARA